MNEKKKGFLVDFIAFALFKVFWSSIKEFVI